MAKVKVKNVKSVLNSVNAIFQDSIKSEKFLREIRDFTVLRIQAETRKGRDLSKEGAPIKDHSDGYKKWRQRLASGESRSEIVPDSKFFLANKSNITLTGQLLESLTGKINKLRSEIEVMTTENRRDGEKNNLIVQDLKKRGFTFLGLDEKGVRVIRKKALDEIRRQIRRRGFTK